MSLLMKTEPTFFSRDVFKIYITEIFQKVYGKTNEVLKLNELDIYFCLFRGLNDCNFLKNVQLVRAFY